MTKTKQNTSPAYIVTSSGNYLAGYGNLKLLIDTENNNPNHMIGLKLSYQKVAAWFRGGGIRFRFGVAGVAYCITKIHIRHGSYTRTNNTNTL